MFCVFILIYILKCYNMAYFFSGSYMSARGRTTIGLVGDMGVGKTTLAQTFVKKQFCEKTCNLMWAKRFAFSIVSSRVSFRGRLTAIWSSEPVKLTQQRVISNPVGCVDNDIARIASLAVYSRSAEFLDQVIYCAKDCRASIIDDLWALLLNEFLCNTSWAPCHKYTYNGDVSKITPESACSVGIDIPSVRELWTTVLSYLSGIFSRKDYTLVLDVDTIWSAYVCTSAIPTCHHAITMWVLLLWTSNSISPFLKHAVKQ
jgi:hypothetical protein